MTPEEWIEKLKAFTLEVKETNSAFALAVNSVKGEIATRAFIDGKNKDGISFTYDDKVPDMSSSLPKVSGTIVTSEGGQYRGMWVSDNKLRKKGTNTRRSGDSKSFMTRYETWIKSNMLFRNKLKPCDSNFKPSQGYFFGRFVAVGE